MDTQRMRTSGETLAEQTALVVFVLEWIGAHAVTSFAFAEELPLIDNERWYQNAIQTYARQLSDDAEFVGSIVGHFVIRKEEPGGVDAATWGQS